MIQFIQYDGYIFLLIGLIALFMPGPQAILKSPIDEEHLPQFHQSRRLLAAMFISLALLLIVVGRNVTNGHALTEIAIARVISLELLFLLLYIQYKNKKWKEAPLIAMMILFGLISVVYLYFLSI